MTKKTNLKVAPKATKKAASELIEKAVPLTIGGKAYTLEFDFNQLAEAELEMQNKVNLLHGMAAFLLGTQTAAQTVALFYALLQVHHRYQPVQHGHPKIGISLMEAAEMMSLANLPNITVAMRMALVASDQEAA